MSPRRHGVLFVLVAIALAAPARGAVELATLDTPGTIRDLVLDGTIAYVADAIGGVRVIDVANPLAPAELASLPPVQLGNVQAVYLDGDRLYTAESSGGVGVIDVANPASPVRLGRVTGMSQVLDVVAAGDHAYAVSNVGPGFYVIDVSVPATPVVVASLGATGSTIRWVSATRLAAGNRLVDVSDPLNPWIVAEGSRIRARSVTASASRPATSAATTSRIPRTPSSSTPASTRTRPAPRWRSTPSSSGASGRPRASASST